jgi:hypothetical protein
MQIIFWLPAGTYVPGKGEFPQTFETHAFDGVLGREVPVTRSNGGQVIGRGILTAAVVDADGGGVTLTIDMAGDVPDLPQDISFSFREPDPPPRIPAPLTARPPVVRWRLTAPRDTP